MRPDRTLTVVGLVLKIEHDTGAGLSIGVALDDLLV